MAPAQIVRDGDRRRRPGGARDGYHLGEARPIVRDPRRGRACRRSWRGAGTRCGSTRPPVRRAPGHALPGEAHVISDDARDGRLPRGVRGALRAARSSGTAVDTLAKDDGGYVAAPRATDVRGRQRGRRDRRDAEAPTFRLRAGARPAASLSSTRATTETSRSCRRARARGRREPLGRGHRPRGRRDARDHSLGPGHRQIPASVDTRRGRMGFRLLVLRRLAHPHRWTRRWGARCGRTSDTAARRSCATGRRICSPRASSECSRGRSASRTAGPCSTTVASSTSGTSSGAPASGGTSRGSTFRSSWAKTDTRCSIAASSPRAGALLRRAAVPPLVHVDAHLRRGKGCGAGGARPRVPTR